MIQRWTRFKLGWDWMAFQFIQAEEISIHWFQAWFDQIDAYQCYQQRIFFFFDDFSFSTVLLFTNSASQTWF